ncbi:MAG: DUF4142 domain-containing protein [Ferruginibacter sp.]
MKKIVYAALIPAAMFLACNDNKSTSEMPAADSTIPAIDKKDNVEATTAPDSSGKMSSDKTITDKDVTDFVNNTSAVGMMEVELGKYAAAHGASQRVKDFGNMMVTDHTAAGDKLKTMAAANNIPVPSALPKDKQMHVDMLEKKSGKDFDKAYMDMMVDGHKETIGNFKKASADLKEDSYKTFATMTLPVLQKHLDSAQAIRKSL